jgi:hypothetical protein
MEALPAPGDLAPGAEFEILVEERQVLAAGTVTNTTPRLGGGVLLLPPAVTALGIGLLERNS